MSLGKKEVMNELYNTGLITLGVVATSMVSRKLTKDGLGVTSSAQRTEVGRSSRRGIGIGEIPSDKGLHSERTIQKDQLDKWLAWWQEGYSTR